MVYNPNYSSFKNIKYMDELEFRDFIEKLLSDSLSSKDPRTHSTKRFNFRLKENTPDYFVTSPGVLMYSQLYKHDAQEFKRFNHYFSF